MFPFRPRRLSIAWLLLLSLSGVSALSQNQSAESFDSIVQSANAARDSGNADEAIRDYTRALALHPNWAEGWWDLGTMQYQANHYEDAVASLDKLTALAPNAAAGWSILGLSQFEIKDYSGALASLEKAQKLGGINDPEIKRVSAYHLGLLLIRNGQFEPASTLLHSSFGEAPPAQVKVALGLALLHIPLLPSEIDPSHDALIHEAGDAAASSDPVQALADLTQQYPKAPWLHHAFAEALERAGRPREARAQRNLEAAISPADSAHSVGSPARDTRMIALYGIRSASAAEDPNAWKGAMRDYSAGQYPEAVAALKPWLEANPDNGTAWAVMGLSEFDLKDYANARIHLQRGINLGIKASPQAIRLATDRLALLLIRNRQFDAASALLTPQAGKPPIADQIQLALGLALLRIPVLPEELDAQQNGLAQAGGAIVELLLASRYADAFPAFQKLIAQYPTTPWLHYAYGDALNDLSRYDEAKTQMLDETRLSPRSALPWIRIAAIDVRQHLPADALKAAQTAASLNPGSAEAHYQLGRAWLENSAPQKAISELEKANSLTPNNPEIHFALARAYTKANMPDKAAAERDAFLQLKASSHRDKNSAPAQSVLQTNTQ